MPTTFQEALDIVESLPEEQQEHLVRLLRNRQIERRREEIAENICEGRAEHARGETRRGSVDDLIDELEGQQGV